MTGVLTLAWLHYLAMMFLAAALITEHLMFSPRPERAIARKLVVIDSIYGVSLLVVFATGMARMFHDVKPVLFYMQSGAYHTKFSLFIIMAVVWIYPAIKFFGWRRTLRAGGEPSMSEAESKRVLMAIRIQLLILVFLPLLAVMMARGVWF